MKSVRFILLLAATMWAGSLRGEVLTPRDFTREFSDALRTSDPTLRAVVVADLELKVTAPDGRESITFLNNAYDEYKFNPEAKAEIIQRFVASATEMAKPASDEINVGSIVPVVKDRPWLEDAVKGLRERGAKEAPQWVYDDFGDDLVILYVEDTPKNIRYLTPADLEKTKIARSELRELACRNLKRILPEIDRRGGRGTYMITAGGNYEASLLLLDSLWSGVQPDVQGEIVVAIPTRDLLLVTGSESPEGLRKVKELVAKATREASYRLTTKLFVLRNGKFVEFVEKPESVAPTPH